MTILGLALKATALDLQNYPLTHTPHLIALYETLETALSRPLKPSFLVESNLQSNVFWAGGDWCYGEGRHVIQEDFRETWATPLWEALWATSSAAWDLLAMWIYDPRVPLSCTEVFVSQRGKCIVLANAKFSYPVVP